MVDVGATAPALSASIICVTAADDAALRDYAAFCQRAVYGPCQHPLWLSSWIASAKIDALIVTISQNEQPVLMLALEVVCKGRLRIARFIGGNHANGNFVAMDRQTPIALPDIATLKAAVRKARPDIDLVFLSRQDPYFQGFKNPLTSLATMKSPNISLAIDLSGGFEAVLSRHNPARKRKRFNYQLSRFRQTGGYRLIETRTTEEVGHLLDLFFELKGASLREKGIADAFAAPQIRAFFRALFCNALNEANPPFLLRAVEVGGEIVAITGLSVTRDTVVCDFNTFKNRDPKTSPGSFLDHTNIEWACQQGKAIYDFSVGEEDYKRSWCDIETWQFETLLPLSASGAALALYERGRMAGIRAIKSNPTLWAFIKRIRARLGGKGDQPT